MNQQLQVQIVTLCQRGICMNAINFLSAMQNSAETIGAYIMRLQLLTISCDYGGVEEEMIRNHVVMSCVPSRLRRCLLQQKDLSLSLSLSLSLELELELELVQRIAPTMELSDQKCKAFSNMMTVSMLLRDSH